MASPCTALRVSDSRPCTEVATSQNGLFCREHSKEAVGLYRGYKNRNARLDELVANPPSFLAEHSIPLANQTFSDVEAESTLEELHDYLFLRFQLLDRVIRARKLHHSRFFAQNMDYGHQHYLDQLQSQRFVVLKALERLERRTAEVLYKKCQWFKWVRTLENEEEAHRENEKKKLKLEAALFQRHQKEAVLRMEDLRAKEDKKRQAEYLDHAYEQRMAQAGGREEPTEEEEASWDPIEDVLENERGNYINMILHFLWDESTSQYAKETSSGTLNEPDGNIQHAQSKSTSSTTTSKKSKKRGKGPVAGETQQKPGSVAIETRATMRQRLADGMEYEHGAGWVLRGTLENPLETMHKTAPMPNEDIEELLRDVAEIKQLLFCRLLLAHAGVLPAALRAVNIQDFLNDESVTETDLRDICLKMEQPGLQELRDACADLGRGNEETPDEGTDDEDDVTQRSARRYMGPMFRSKGMPKVWSSKREQAIQKKRTKTLNPENGSTFIDFGAIDDSGQYVTRRIRVKVCGRYIYNYPSETAMLRGGWLQFSIVAKGSNLFDAMTLCRSWDEFFEVSVLASWQYFPASNWAGWVADRRRQQLMHMGFFPYFQNEHADEMSVRTQTGSRSHGVRRQHAILEVRNFICGHIKRNDPASRRFVQYISMRTCDMAVLVRDAQTGKIIVRPPEEELWLIRQKSGMGRAAKNDWNVIKSIGPTFFQEMDDHRQWHFGFKDHYDLIVWDLEPGQHFSALYNNIQELLIKAHRFTKGTDFYSLMAPILKTITRETETHRVRDIKPGEDVPSLWDGIQSPETRFMTTIIGTGSGARELESAHVMYNESDAREDEILFPEELQRDGTDATVRDQITQKIFALETEGPSMDRFVYDLDTDEDFSDDEAAGSAEKETATDYGTESDMSSDEERIDDPSGHLLDMKMSPDARRLMDIFKGGQEDLPAMMEKLKTMLTLKPKQTDAEIMEAEMDVFLDRQRAAIFKESWHRADLELGAFEKHIESSSIVKQTMKFDEKLRTRSGFDAPLLLYNLDVDADMHHRIYRDALQAIAMMAMFFPDLLPDKFRASFEGSWLVDQITRAESVPERRTFLSNKYNDKNLWKDWDEICTVKRDGKNFESTFDGTKYPPDWNLAVRPLIAKRK